jgi:hypothetical protein
MNTDARTRNWNHIRLRNRTRRNGSVDVDDLGGRLWSRSPATRDQISAFVAAREARKAAREADRKARKAGITIGKDTAQPITTKAFAQLDPKNGLSYQASTWITRLGPRKHLGQARWCGQSATGTTNSRPHRTRTSGPRRGYLAPTES